MSRKERGKWNVPPAGETFTLDLESLSHQGATLARREGQVVFAAYGIPSERAEVLIERVHKDYLEGRVTEVQQASPHRVEPRCEYFGTCGGCQLQHIDYDYQLELKRGVVIEQLRRIGRLTEVEVRPALPSPDPWQYRNHARFTVDRDGYLGFTIRGRKRIVRLENCYIVHPWIRDTMRALQGRCRGMRQVAMRIGVNTGETLIQPPLMLDRPDTRIVPPPNGTASDGSDGRRPADTGEHHGPATTPRPLIVLSEPAQPRPHAPDLGASGGGGEDTESATVERAAIASLPSPDTSARPMTATGDAPDIESGQRSYDEELLGERFHVSAASFFQVNTPQAETLIRLVRDGLQLGPDDVLLDAYAGVGTFAKTLAASVRKVIAIEVSASSVADGRANTLAKANVEWLQGEVEALLPELTERPAAVVLDPSRQGCGAAALDALIAAAVPRIAYVSCDPATLARDLRLLVDGGYRIEHVQPVDLFPQTYHIECVALLRYAGPAADALPE